MTTRSTETGYTALLPPGAATGCPFRYDNIRGALRYIIPATKEPLWSRRLHVIAVFQNGCPIHAIDHPRRYATKTGSPFGRATLCSTVGLNNAQERL